MTAKEMNDLRPGDKVVYEAAKAKTLGVIKAVWRDSHFRVRWKGVTTDDEINITKEGDPHLHKAK